MNTSLLNSFKSPIRFRRWGFLLFCCTDDTAEHSRKLHYAHVVTKSRKSTRVSVPRLSVLPTKLSSFLESLCKTPKWHCSLLPKHLQLPTQQHKFHTPNLVSELLQTWKPPFRDMRLLPSRLECFLLKV